MPNVIEAPFPITQKELEKFRATYPQHTDLLERCINDGGVVITSEPEVR